MARSYKGYYFGLSIRLWEFDSPTSRQIFAEVAHLVEHLFEAQGVVGSSPTLGTILCPISKMDDYAVLRTQRCGFDSCIGCQFLGEER